MNSTQAKFLGSPCRTSLEVLLGQLQCQYTYLKGAQYYSFQKSSLTDLDPDIYMVDDRLYKNAEPIQFSNMIERYGKPKKGFQPVVY